MNTPAVFKLLHICIYNRFENTLSAKSFIIAPVLRVGVMQGTRTDMSHPENITTTVYTRPFDYQQTDIHTSRQWTRPSYHCNQNSLSVVSIRYSKCHVTSNKVTSKLECAENKFQTRGWVREIPPTTSYARDLTRNAGPCSKLRVTCYNRADGCYAPFTMSVKRIQHGQNTGCIK
jgi:hypothetical protein